MREERREEMRIDERRICIGDYWAACIESSHFLTLADHR